MDLASRKLAFIEDYLHLSNEKLIDKLDTLLPKEKKSAAPKRKLSDFFGIMSIEEGTEFMNNIENGCSNINYNEW
ncbi:MAG: hypothetical protein WCX31_05440 [Salinivirgaceae bacterium]|jgi:hypothetical protein